MPEHVVIESASYDCVIWSSDISDSQRRLEKTLQSRGKSSSPSRVLLSPELLLSGAVEPTSEYLAAAPVFFENRQYHISFIFKISDLDMSEVDSPRVVHRLKAIEDAFHYDKRTHALNGTVSTGNDVGWFRIELVYVRRGVKCRQAFAFEILPTKMDLASDLELMARVIDEEFPLWRFALAEKTQQQMGATKKPHSQFLLLWLAQFESLQDEMLRGLRHIINAPHSRLLSIHESVRMDRIKGRLSGRLEEFVAEEKSHKNHGKRFRQQKKQLSVDTPENRFIKSVINVCTNKLSKIVVTARENQSAPEKQRLSESFFEKLTEWQISLRYFQRQPLFREIGDFSGLTIESLVLQQKPGYAKVYKVWQQLKWYLEFLGSTSNMSLRNVAELYEIWCFLEVRRVLLSLDFVEKDASRIPMVSDGLEVKFSDGLSGTFRFERKQDAVKLKLAHEPRFGKNGAPIKSWITTQIPDIFLEASFPDGKKFVWIFDAKYRIRKPRTDDQGNPIDSPDLVPDDAINQMHRYRDALIHQSNLNFEIKEKTRPVFGAYALYPGFYDQEKELNPYQESIDEVGIGAFSLLPSTDNTGSKWLSDFLSKKLAKVEVEYSFAASEQHFVDESSRIPYLGTNISRYLDLTIVVNQLGPARSDKYIDMFKNGDAQYYHTKSIAFERQSIEIHVIREARYLAVALDVDDCTREVTHLYPIIEAKLVARKEITEAQAGTGSYRDPEEKYWLFRLGKSLGLKRKVVQRKMDSFAIKLSGNEDIFTVDNWDDLPERYRMLRV